MAMQASSKYETNCIDCGETIYRSEERRVDGALHYHFTCPDSETVKERAEGLLFYRLLGNRVK